MPKIDSSVHTRVLGLDILRSVAIILVVVCHICLCFFCSASNSEGRTAFAYVLGYYGVELFFVLSGYLIGRMLCRTFIENPTIAGACNFYKRRFLRILPAYYAILCILILFHFENGNSVKFWQYFIMLQNFDHAAEFFFPVSWSLAIESFSYIAAPVVLGYFPRLFKKQGFSAEWSIIYSIIFFCFFVLMGRIVNFYVNVPEWDANIRKQVPMRLDAIFWGVLVCLIERFFNRLYNWLMQKWVAVLFGVVNLLSAYILYDTMISNDSPTGPSYSLFYCTFNFSLTGILLSGLLPFFSQDKNFSKKAQKNCILSKIFISTSRLSYSIYLVHFTVFQIVSQNFLVDGMNFFIRVVVNMVGLILAICVSCLLYYFVERPFLILQKKLFDSY